MTNTLLDFYNDPESYRLIFDLEKGDIITDILINRSSQCFIDIFKVFKELAEHSEYLDRHQEDTAFENKLIAIYKFDVAFGVLIKYLYPLNEQLETAIDEMFEVRKAII